MIDALPIDTRMSDTISVLRRENAKKQAEAARPVAPETQEKLINNRVWVMEIFIILVLLSVFCGSTIFVTSIVFPSGMTLRDLMNRDSTAVAWQESGAVLGTAQQNENLPGLPLPFSAEVVWLLNDVRHKVSKDIAWRRSRLGMILSDNDALQTFEKSGARLVFDNDNILEVHENSLIIIDSAWVHERSRFPVKEYKLAIEGTFEGKIKRDPLNEVHFKIMLEDEVVTIRPAKTETEEVTFKAIKTDTGALSVAIYKGNAEIQIGEKVQKVPEEHAFTIESGAININPIELPPPPDLHSPPNNYSVIYRERPPKLDFSWSGIDSKLQYGFIMARDPDFKDIVIQEKINGDVFECHNLRAGQYYWKVFGMLDNLPSYSSEVRTLNVTEDRLAPVIKLKPIPKVVNEQRVVVQGKIEDGSQLSVLGETVNVRKNGYFSHAIDIDQGVNILVIEASDDAGNISYKTSRVIGKF